MSHIDCLMRSIIFGLPNKELGWMVGCKHKRQPRNWSKFWRVTGAEVSLAAGLMFAISAAFIVPSRELPIEAAGASSNYPVRVQLLDVDETGKRLSDPEMVRVAPKGSSELLAARRFYASAQSPKDRTAVTSESISHFVAISTFEKVHAIVRQWQRIAANHVMVSSAQRANSAGQDMADPMAQTALLNSKSQNGFLGVNFNLSNVGTGGTEIIENKEVYFNGGLSGHFDIAIASSADIYIHSRDLLRAIDGKVPSSFFAKVQAATSRKERMSFDEIRGIGLGVMYDSVNDRIILNSTNA